MASKRAGQSAEQVDSGRLGSGDTAGLLARARLVAAEVPDPELPFVTVADLGILRGVRQDGDVVVAEVSPTYSGCPAVAVNGIAPPAPGGCSKPVSFEKPVLFEKTAVTCPHCGGTSTDRISEFGSTPCKAQYRCLDCREPFDYFKCL